VTGSDLQSQRARVPQPQWGRVAVTGATGFVGRHLVQRLRVKGVNVLELSRAHGFDICRDEIPLDGVDYVLHLAGATGVPKAWHKPLEFFEINALGTVRVLDCCRHAGCGVTYLSAYIYGVPQYLPIAEDHPVASNNPYAFSKWIGEEACSFFAHNYGVSCVMLRLFNTFGPGQSLDFIVPSIVAQVLDQRRKMIEVQDLGPQRDYLYIDDAVEAVLAASGAASGSIFNIGSGLAYSVEDIIRTAMAVAGVEKPYRAVGQRRRNEIDCVVADTTALRNAVGWTPRVSFEAGLHKLIASMV
jgi:nucleoside-diphosphate-sugar epimerase